MALAVSTAIVFPARPTRRGRRGDDRRYFIEKSPIYFEPDEGSPVPSFCYVDEGALSTSGFMSFLNRYRLLFVSLRRFRLTDVAAEHRPFRRALGVFERFETSLDHPEDLLPSELLGEYFRLRFYLESRQHHLSDKAKPDRFRNPSAEKSFREWTDEMARSRSSEPVEADFKLHRLYHRYDIFRPSRRPFRREEAEHQIAAGVPPLRQLRHPPDSRDPIELKGLEAATRPLRASRRAHNDRVARQ